MINNPHNNPIQEENYNYQLVKFLGKKRIDSEKFDLIKSIIGENLSEQEVVCNEIDSLNEKRNKLIDEARKKFLHLVPSYLKCPFCRGLVVYPVRMTSGLISCNNCFVDYCESQRVIPNNIIRCPVTGIEIREFSFDLDKEALKKIKKFKEDNPVYKKVKY